QKPGTSCINLRGCLEIAGYEVPSRRTATLRSLRGFWPRRANHLCSRPKCSASDLTKRCLDHDLTRRSELRAKHPNGCAGATAAAIRSIGHSAMPTLAECFQTSTGRDLLDEVFRSRMDLLCAESTSAIAGRSGPETFSSAAWMQSNHSATAFSLCLEFIVCGLASIAIGFSFFPILRDQERYQSARLSGSARPRRDSASLLNRLVKIPTAVDSFPTDLTLSRPFRFAPGPDWRPLDAASRGFQSKSQPSHVAASADASSPRA